MATASASSAPGTALHSIGGMPHGLGLLTTVASLPPKYRSRYLNIKTKCEIPLDLSVKPMSPQIANDVPMATNFTEVYTEPSVEQASAGVGVTAIAAAAGAVATPTDAADLLIASIATAVAQEHEQEQQRQRECEEASQREHRTPPPSYAQATTKSATVTSKGNTTTSTHTPLKRKWVERERAERERELESAKKQMKLDRGVEETASTATSAIATATTSIAATTTTMAAEGVAKKKECHTPNKPIRVSDAAPRTIKSQPHSTKSAKANKATRKLKFDEETSSPVSGTIIRPLEDVTDGTMQYSNGDIDPRYNIVEITEETKAELAAIKNVIGDYICKLCRLKFEDAFGLAQHRCACIVLLEYRCPECGKQFNCPANLASHRRWHKPKKGDGAGGANGTTSAGAVAKKENRQSNGNVPPAQSNRKVEELEHTCEQCGKQFKRLAYLRKHQLTHNNNNPNNNSNGPSNAKKAKSGTAPATGTQPLTAPIVLDYPSYASSSASVSSVHSFALHTSPRHTPPHAAAYERTLTMHVAATKADTRYGRDDGDSLSECSRSSGSSSSSSGSSSAGYGRLQIVESGLTEEENIAAAALTNLRNCASVIQHTTMAH